VKNRLRIALQKKGRMAQESLNLLKACGLKFRMKDNALLTHVDNFPIDLLFIRDDDIPTLVFDEICDGGIVGDNVLQEAALKRPQAKWQNLINLGSCRCRLSIAVPEQFEWSGPGSLDGKRIATSYPELLQGYLNRYQLQADILNLSGSIEVAPRMGMADAICDLVSSGQTLEDNQLKEVDVIMPSEAVFIRSAKQYSPEQEDLFNLLVRRIEGVQKAQECKYILFHAPKSALASICACLPGVESPTVIPQADQPDKVVVHVVSSERIFWNTLEQIQELGASSILVLPIEKMLTD
jgi:ATP phosphoribosyltransferase